MRAAVGVLLLGVVGCSTLVQPNAQLATIACAEGAKLILEGNEQVAAQNEVAQSMEMRFDAAITVEGGRSQSVTCVVDSKARRVVSAVTNGSEQVSAAVPF